MGKSLEVSRYVLNLIHKIIGGGYLDPHVMCFFLQLRATLTTQIIDDDDLLESQYDCYEG